MRDAGRWLLGVGLMTAALAGCQGPLKAHTAPPVQPRWKSVTIYGKLRFAPGEFVDAHLDQLGLKQDGPGIVCIPVDDSVRNLLDQMARWEYPNVGFFAHHVPPHDLPADARVTIDGMLSMDVAVEETRDHQLAVTIKAIRPASKPEIRQQSFVNVTPFKASIHVPGSNPGRVTIPSPGNVILLGITMQREGEPELKKMVVFLQAKASPEPAGTLVEREKRVVENLFGVGYDEPTSRPAPAGK